MGEGGCSGCGGGCEGLVSARKRAGCRSVRRCSDKRFMALQAKCANFPRKSKRSRRSRSKKLKLNRREKHFKILTGLVLLHGRHISNLSVPTSARKKVLLVLSKENAPAVGSASASDDHETRARTRRGEAEGRKCFMTCTGTCERPAVIYLNLRRY